jgi:hypothetical protein
MQQELNEVNWKELLEDKNVEETWNEIKKQYDNMVGKCVPIRKVRKKKKLSFMTKSTTKMINKRERDCSKSTKSQKKQ